MKKYSVPLALFNSGLLLLYMILELVEASTFPFAVVVFVSFGLSLLLSLYVLITQNWRPFAIQISALAFAVGIPLLFQVEMNYYHFLDDREQLVEMLENGELERTSDDGSSVSYLTPDGYKRAVGSNQLPVVTHSESEFYVKFWVDEPIFNPNGAFEGFLYSSNGEFPATDSALYFYEYKQIDANWYYVSDYSRDLEENCLFLCGDIIIND